MEGIIISKFPVILSISVNCMPTIVMLGSQPKFIDTALFIDFVVTQAIDNILTAYIVITVYFQCGVSIIYECKERMSSKHHLGILDYLMVALSLAISAIIGIMFRFSGGQQKTTDEYLMAGRNMSKFPVVLSLAVTGISTIAMLGFPAEIYRFGIPYALYPFTQAIGNILAVYIVVPVYFQCGVSTIYEFLEIRFGKTTRYAVSILFIIEMVTYMATALYGPALAMSAVTDISVETSIVVFAGVCTFYCTIGGLKAVLWTDVFQSGLMFISILIVYTTAIIEVGGVSEIYEKALAGKRMDLFDFTFDLTTRHTFWNILFLGLIDGIGSYSTNQIQVQRLLSLSTCERAQSAFMWSIFPISGLLLSCSLLGIVLYAVFYLCDPIINHAETGLNKYDQLLPFYIVTRLASIPCLTGLCISGIFCGSLSTISSAINSLSAVTVADIIKPMFPSVRFSDAKLVFIAKSLVVFYGALCVCVAFIISQSDSIFQVSSVALGAAEGPVYAIFLLGILTTRTTEKNILFGLIVAVAVSSWIGYGSLFSDYSNPSLPLNTSLCPSEQNISSIYDNSTVFCHKFQNCSGDFSEIEHTPKEPFVLYRISFMWVMTIGWVITIFISYMCSLFTGWNQTNEVNVKCLSPIARFWIPNIAVGKRDRMKTRNIELERKSTDPDVTEGALRCINNE